MAVQGHPMLFDLDVNRKRICDFLFAIRPTSNFGRISYRFRAISA